MKTLRHLFVALALSAASVLPAFAQTWQVPANSIPVGRGPAVQGFDNIANGVNGQALFGVSGGKPTFRSILYTDLPSGTSDTVLGYWGSTVLSGNSVPSCATALTYSQSTHLWGCNSSGGGGSGTPGNPGGRLTLISGTPEMNVDTVSTNLFYAPDEGNACPILNAGSWSSFPFTSSATDKVGLTLALAGSSAWPANTIFDVFCLNNAGTIQLGTRAWDSSMLPSFAQISSNTNTTLTTGTSGTTWNNSSNAFDGTLSKPASTSAITSTPNAGLNNCLGQDLGSGNAKVLTKVSLTEPNNASFRGDDPAAVVTSTYGSNDNTNWNRLDANRNIPSTVGTYGNTYTYTLNANIALPSRYFRVCFTGVGTTGNNLHIAQIQFFTTNPPAARRLAPYNGILTNDNSMTAQISTTTSITVPQNQGTYLGSFQTDAGAAGSITAHFQYGSTRVLNLWNMYHRKTVTLLAGQVSLNSALPASASYRYDLTWPTNADWTGIQSGGTYTVQTLVGYVGTRVEARFSRQWYLNGTPGTAGAYEFGIGVDTTTAFSGNNSGTTGDAIGGTEIGYQGYATVSLPPFFGTHTFNGIERLTYANTAEVTVFEDVVNSGLTVTTEY